MKYNSIELIQLDDVDFFEIVQQYRESHRIYHSYEHIEHMFNISDLYKLDRNLNGKTRTILEFAILYHDFYYDLKATDNEIRSAYRAYKVLSNYKFTQEELSIINLCILSTIKHVPLCEEAKILIDLDLSCLLHNYQGYKEKIRKEYLQIYTLQEYIQGRIKFLDSMVNKDRIFYSFLDTEEKTNEVKENMKKEIEELKKEQNNA